MSLATEVRKVNAPRADMHAANRKIMVVLAPDMSVMGPRTPGSGPL